MAFNKISLNKIDAQSVSTFNIPLLNKVEGAQTDIIYHLGTQLRTVETYTNPANTSVLTLTSSQPGVVRQGAPDNPAVIHDRDFVSYFSLAALGDTLNWNFLTGYEVDINAYVWQLRSSTSYPTAWRIEGSNDNSTWKLIHSFSGFDPTNYSNNDLIIYRCPNRHGFFKYIRYVHVANSDTNNVIGDFYFYGRIRNLTTGVAGYTSYNGSFESFANTDVINLRDNRVIKYDGTDWESTPRFPWQVHKLNLTQDYLIDNAYIAKYYIVSPGGAPRTITLPSNPKQDDAIKIKNVDGAQAITIEETAGDLNPVVLSNSGKLQYEFVYDGTEWLVNG